MISLPYFYEIASILIHFPSLISQLPNVVIYLFILFASSNRFPFDSVFDTLSLPAKSTIFNIALMYFVSPSSIQRCNNTIWITAWLLDDRLFFIIKKILSKSPLFFSILLPVSHRKTTPLLTWPESLSGLWCKFRFNRFISIPVSSLVIDQYLALIRNQVKNIVKIKFDETDSNCELSHVHPLFYPRKNVFYRIVKVSRFSMITITPKYCVGFPSSSLTVCEEGSVVSFKERIHKMLAFFINIFLFSRIKNPVKFEGLFLVVFSLQSDARFGGWEGLWNFV